MLFDGYFQQLLLGLLTTIKVACAALIFGLFMGLLGATAESSRIRILQKIFIVWHTIIRGVPELLILFFMYFGAAEIINHFTHQNINVSSFWAGVIGLGFIFGAYASQTLRGAFLAIPLGQIEAAKALGLARWQTFRLILLPQAWRHALPGLGNLWLVLLKDTALVSLIGLADIMMRAQNAAINTAKPFTFYLLAALAYLLLTSISEVTLFYCRRRSSKYLAHS